MNYKAQNLNNQKFSIKIDNINNYNEDSCENLENYKILNQIVKNAKENFLSNRVNLFFQNIFEIKELISQNSFPFLKLFGEYEFLEIFFSFLSDDTKFESNYPIVSCLEIMTRNEPLLLQNDFINLIKINIINALKLEDNDKLLLLLQIVYNLAKNISQQNQADIFLSIFSLNDFFEILQNCRDNDIKIIIFLLIKELSIYFTSNASNNVKCLFQIIHFFFQQLKGTTYQNNTDLKMITCFARMSLISIYNIIIIESFDFPLFLELKLFELLNYFLIFPPIEMNSVVCNIIAQLIQKYNLNNSCDFLNLIDFQKIIKLYFAFNSERNQYSAVIAIKEMIIANNNLSSYFFDNNCMLLFEFIDTFDAVSSKTKIQLFFLLYTLLNKASMDQWKIIFEREDCLYLNQNHNDEVHLSLFYIVSQVFFSNIEDLQAITLQAFILLFENGTKLNISDKCIHFFNNFLSTPEIESIIEETSDEKLMLTFQLFKKKIS